MGLGRWDPVWDHIGAPSDEFMDRLAEWEKADSASTRSKLETASTVLIDAWAEAARRWTEAGSPPLEKPGEVDEVEADVGQLVSP